MPNVVSVGSRCAEDGEHRVAEEVRDTLPCRRSTDIGRNGISTQLVWYPLVLARV